MPEQSPTTGAVFLSYASQDAEAAARICEALRAAGVEVWLDKSELRGGDAWDAQIKKHIHDCALFLPVISAHTNARTEGYFRGEWNLATRRLLNMAHDAPFLVPVVIDDTREVDARVPEEFLRAQWTQLPSGETPPAFAQRVRQLLSLDRADIPTAHSAESRATEPWARDRNPVWPRGLLRVWWVASALFALLLILGGGFWYYQVASNRPTAIPAATNVPAVAAANEKSIAVLPFVDMSAEKNQEYMADGIAEELLNLLSQAADLKVIARTSSFAFKGQNIDVSEIAKRLNVAHVLEGSVRTSGNKLRITAQLIRASDSSHLWSASYDRPLDDIFAVQDEIANAIVQALQIKLMGGTLSRPEGGTQNLKAYQLYLRALSASNENTKASLDAAERYAEEATKLDPGFGRAWSALAWAILTQADNSFLPKQGYERGRQLAQHALQVSPNLADAHAALAHVHQFFDWNWTACEAELKRALDENPTEITALQGAGLLAITLGRWDEAERRYRAALNRDPLDNYSRLDLGKVYYLAGRLTEAEEQFRQLLKLEPDFLWTRRWLGKTLLAQGKPEAALAMVQQEVDEANRLAILPVLLQAAGRKSEADEALKMLIAHWGDTWPLYVAQTYAYRGDHDRALEWLERAYRQNDSALASIVGEPLFKSMAGDPRFKAFLRKMKLPEG